MRRTYRYNAETGDMEEISYGASEKVTATVIGDTPGYVSPVTGLWVEGRKARRNDLKRSRCRPYEGREQEEKEAARQRAYEEQKQDRKLDEAVRRAYHQLSPEKRRILEDRR